jgi:hypothetical protein
MRRRVLGAALALVCAGLLASCSVLSSGPWKPVGVYDEPQRKSDIEIQRLAAAVQSRDPAALKKLFSPNLQKSATGLDVGLTRFLSFFPSGRMTWRRDGSASEGDIVTWKKNSEELFALYRVTADGKEYELYFADFIANQVDEPDNVGFYALGVTPYEADPNTASGEKKPFYAWAGQFSNRGGETRGTPGVYVP